MVEMADMEAGEMQGGTPEVSMRKVILSMYVTLDGVMEDPGGAERFEHGGWSIQFFDEDAAKYAFDQLFASDALLLGRVTYQGFADAWPSMTDEEGFADRMNSLPKFVVSKTLEEVEWNNSRLIKENIAEEVSKLKQQPGQDILIYGSGDLVHTLMRHNLIDEYRIWVHPIVLGSGKRLFRGGSDTTVLRLVDTKTFGSGVIVLSYQPARKEAEGQMETGGE
jgi:dihydrofolate reductase